MNEHSVEDGGGLDSIIQMLFQNFGMEKALQFVFSRMVVETSATRLTVIVAYGHSTERMIVADIQPAREEYYRKIQTRSLAAEKYRAPYFTQDAAHTRYFPDLAHDDSAVAQKMKEFFDDVRSVCLAPLFLIEEFSADLVFSAPPADAFSSRDTAMFQEYARAFAPAFRRQYFPLEDGENRRDGQRQILAADPLLLLRMCNSLALVVRQMELVAPANATVLILGESGTGKELVARGIHDLSPRRAGPYIRVNCGALPESLLMSELFGHERGAFTGAVASRPGFFEQADGGTIFLDEVAALSPAAQVALLRVLSTGEIQRVGGSHARTTNARVIAASHGNLQDLVDAGTFRQDVLYRLSVFPILVPPLRARRSDIPSLVHYFLAQKAAALNLPVPEVSKGELHKLCCAPWPGNVRQLEHTLERAMILASANPAAPHLRVECGGASSALPLASLVETWVTLDQHNRDYLQQVLAHTGGKISGTGGACDILGLSPSTLRSKLKKHGIIMPKERKISRVRRAKGRNAARSKEDGKNGTDTKG